MSPLSRYWIVLASSVLLFVAANLLFMFGDMDDDRTGMIDVSLFVAMGGFSLWSALIRCPKCANRIAAAVDKDGKATWRSIVPQRNCRFCGHDLRSSGQR
jgi:hypothetical protein